MQNLYLLMPNSSSFKDIFELFFKIINVHGENFLKIDKRADQNKTV